MRSCARVVTAAQTSRATESYTNVIYYSGVTHRGANVVKESTSWHCDIDAGCRFVARNFVYVRREANEPRVRKQHPSGFDFGRVPHKIEHHNVDGRNSVVTRKIADSTRESNVRNSGAHSASVHEVVDKRDDRR